MFTQISYWAFRDAPAGQRNVVEAMGMAKEAGFDGIELTIESRGQITPDTPTNECRNLAAAAKAMGVKVGSVASGLLWSLNPASKDRKIRQQALDITKKSLQVTAELGAKHLLVLSGHVDVFFMPQSEVVPYADCYERSLEFARAVGRHAAKLGVTACIENVWNRFLMSPLEFKAFLEKVKNPNVGMYFDVGNVWNFGYPQHWITILGKLIRRVHVKDFRRAVGNANGFVKLGEGDVPLKESLALLKKKANYKGPVTAEVSPGRDDLDERAFLKETAQKLRDLLPR